MLPSTFKIITPIMSFVYIDSKWIEKWLQCSILFQIIQDAHIYYQTDISIQLLQGGDYQACWKY